MFISKGEERNFSLQQNIRRNMYIYGVGGEYR